MTNQLPLKLFLDKSRCPAAGRWGAIFWGVMNVSQQKIVELRIELFCGKPGRMTEGIKAEFYEQDHHKTINANTMKGCSQHVTAGVGDYDLDVKVSGRFDDGQQFCFVSNSTPTFSFGEIDSRTLEIKIGKSGLLKNMREYMANFQNVRIEAGDDLLADGAGVLAGMITPEARTVAQLNTVKLDNLIEVPLKMAHTEGMYPLDIDKLSTSWPVLGDLQLDFVDENKQKRKTSCEVGDHFIVRIKSSRTTGYLTLLSQGSSGEFYVLAPHDWMDADKFRMEAGVARYWYGDLFPLPDERFADWVEFNEAGVERVFALLTQDKPLIPSPLIPNPKPVSKMSEEEVRAILEEALTRSGTSFALAKVTVVTPANAWARNQ